MVVLAMLGFKPSAAHAAALVPLNPGMELTCQFVNNSGYPDNQIYVAVIARNGAGQPCWVNAAGAMTVIPGGQNVSMYSMTLNTFVGLQFPPTMTSGRLWISYGAPMNMPTFAGGGIAQPNLGNPGDPNINTVFDWMEFNVGGGQIFCNTTQVDMFGIPYTMELYDDGGGLNSIRGIAGCYSDIVSQYQAYMNSHAGAGAFNSLVGPVRIVAPAHGSFAAGQPNGNYFNAYINSVWAGPFRPAGVAQPTTQDVFLATGPLATLPQVNAALNRHVIDNPGNINNPAAYYQTAPANFYSAFWHQVNIANLAYGFAYDDANDQSSLQVSNHPRGLVINLSGCVPTPTRTATRTRTRTATLSMTASSTVSSTRTRTSTVTPSMTPSRTGTPTLSSTATATPSRTATSSLTRSPSFSATGTATASRTATATPTQTSTTSPNSTSSPTPTMTATASSSSTASPSASATVTASNTSTITHTSTATASATLSSTLSNTFSVTLSHTYSATPSHTPTRTRTATETLSSTVTSSVTASRTVTASFSATETPSATRSSTSTSTASPSATASSTVTASFTASPSSTGTSTGTATPSTSPSSSATPPALRLPFQLYVALYNSAGELVRVLYRGAASALPSHLTLSSETLALGAAPLRLSFPGVLETGLSSLDWEGSNDSGQSVSTGIYNLKVETVDPFGKTTALVTAVAVIDVRPLQYLAVFNSAGERVREILLPPGLGLGGFDLGSDTLLVGGQAAALKIDLRRGLAQPFVSAWDGKNDEGSEVASGVYSIVLISRQGSEGTRVMTKSVQVLRIVGLNAASSAYPMQNPVPVGQNSLNIAYSVAAGLQASGALYTLAGELVARTVEAGDRGRLSFSCGHLSAGVYLVRIEVFDGPNVLGKKMIKVALLR